MRAPRLATARPAAAHGPPPASHRVLANSLHLHLLAVIGAGPSGTAVLRSFKTLQNKGVEIPEIVAFEKQSQWGGLWNFTWRTGVDHDGTPVHGSMYRHLWSNGPKECLEFADYSFEEHFGKQIPSYPPREVLFDYITGRVDKSGVKEWVRVNTAVKSVSYDEGKELFTVVSNNSVTGEQAVETFDHVVVCSGHFSTPNVPAFAGAETFPGRILHAHDYRSAEELCARCSSRPRDPRPVPLAPQCLPSARCTTCPPRGPERGTFDPPPPSPPQPTPSGPIITPRRSAGKDILVIGTSCAPPPDCPARRASARAGLDCTGCRGPFSCTAAVLPTGCISAASPPPCLHLSAAASPRSDSAEDIASQCYKYGVKSVTCSWRTAPMGFHWPDNFTTVPLLERIDGKTCHFKDGTSKQASAPRAPSVPTWHALSRPHVVVTCAARRWTQSSSAQGTSTTSRSWTRRFASRRPTSSGSTISTRASSGLRDPPPPTTTTGLNAPAVQCGTRRVRVRVGDWWYQKIVTPVC